MKWTGFILLLVLASCVMQQGEEDIQTVIVTTENTKPTIAQSPFATISPTKVSTITPFPVEPSPTTLAQRYISPPEGWEIASPACTIEECLFRSRGMHPGKNWLTGVAIIEGYYVKVTRTSFGITKTCDGFVITGGSQTMIDSIVGLLEGGNGIYSLTDLGWPIAIIDLESTNQDVMNKIATSSQSVPVRIIGFWPTAEGRSYAVCESPLIILSMD